MFCIKSSLLFILVSLHVISAHFELDYPAARGFDEKKEPIAPCGGFNEVKTHVEMPLNDPFVQIDSGHVYYSYNINLIVGNNPTEADFTSNAIPIGSGKRDYPQDACLPLTIKTDDNIKEGVNATIQIVYDGGDGLLYQCTDVTFTNAASGWDPTQCKNADGSTPQNTSTGSSDNQGNEAASFSKAVGLTFFVACLLSFALL
ncbi:hypothetical protein BDB01DRAFT_792313 [Pilobolus umbonatus]|nr:hypothetical protein BDB01DRAFT_792313 [Pilobolus umbonatus]